MKRRMAACGMVAGMGFLLASGIAGAAEPVATEHVPALAVSGGGDLRFRHVHFDDIPIVADPPGVTRGGENHFFRIRPRLWGQVNFPSQVSVYGRLVNEFRHYETGADRNWDWPDEVIVDSLYLDAKGLLGGILDARIGRQDLIYGTGKVILEGTPKDGSRTICHDAVRLTFHLSDKLACDVLGIYNHPENKLAISSEHRDLTGVDPAFNDMTESGGGLYMKSRQLEAMPWEAYYLYKRESGWTNRRADAMPGRDVHTLGGRLMPATADGLSASIELAGQAGEVDDGRTIQAWMADASLRKRFKNAWMAPSIGVGVYHLSGDDPETGRDEGWNPLWARWPQYSELYVYAFDAEAAGRWSNVTLPYLVADCKPSDGSKLNALAGPMYAPEKNGPGGGNERGWLGTVRLDMDLASSLLTKKDKLSGHITVEVLDPGDYYNVRRTAHFARWELSYAF